jgi:hypothetical protein
MILHNHLGCIESNAQILHSTFAGPAKSLPAENILHNKNNKKNNSVFAVSAAKWAAGSGALPFRNDRVLYNNIYKVKSKK